ncbi:MAG: hypothetical protein O2948_04990 [Proteobacteria bacterium]|nr:hypothetical protein [Pseudomonadota bacterium]
MSALLTEDTFEDTEIIFTAVPVLDTQLPDSQSLEQAEPLPDHVEFLKNKLREQQLRKKRIAARDSDEITSTNSTRNSRAQLWKKMMARTESLNADAEKFNTQSAVLLSALQKLQASIETSQREKETLANSFKGLNADCENLKEELRGGLAILQNETSAAASNNETSAGLIHRIEMLLEETQGNHARPRPLRPFRFLRRRNSTRPFFPNQPTVLRICVARQKALLGKPGSSAKKRVSRVIPCRN